MLNIKIVKLSSLSAGKKAKIIGRNTIDTKVLSSPVNSIINAVRKSGDQALFDYTAKFDQVVLKNLKVTPDEVLWSYSQVDENFIDALKKAAQNTRLFQQSIKPNKTSVFSPQPGIKLYRKWTPIEKVGIYIPGGKANYPSTVLMTVIPAQIAGCKEIVVVCPPQENGSISPFVTVACNELGIKNIYKVGGAQAIAALAYGTQTIPQVYKIFGPGNSYVAAAKLAVSQKVAIDSPAGPSENFIIADETANPVYVAADLITDCEHGPDSAGILITTNQSFAKEVLTKVNEQLASLSTANYVESSFRKNGLIAVADSLKQAIDFCNSYAPEHLQIMVKNPQKLISRITNAGSIFVGNNTCKSAGDYATGANHTLPTSGFAKMYSSLSVLDFGKWTEIQECSFRGLKNISSTIQCLAQAENLPAHVNSVAIRFNENTNK